MRTIVNFLSVEWTRHVPKGVPTMLRKTMIVLADVATLTAGSASRNMFLNIFFVHHNSIAAAEHGSDFRIHANKVNMMK
jgi:hypothetical protein